MNEKKKVRLVIFISGKGGSGKDVCSDYLVKKYGFKIKRVSDKLKEIVALLTDTPLEYNYEKKSHVPKNFEDIGSLAKFQQILGMSMRNAICYDVWLRCLWNSICNSDSEKIIIPDVRLKNEAEFLSKKGAIGIRINRGISLRKSSLGDRDPNHITEIDLDNYKEFDFFIYNNSSKQHVYDELEKILKNCEIKT